MQGDYKYSVAKAAEEQHYTLGVAYPANQVDLKGEYTTPEELEITAWRYMAKHGYIGIQHQNGTKGHGIPVESYIYRGPDWTVGDQTVHAGDWMLGVVWDDPAWFLIKKGMLTGYSIDGKAYRKKTDPPESPDKETAKSGEEVT
jgi:hypothetical protein